MKTQLMKEVAILSASNATKREKAKVSPRMEIDFRGYLEPYLEWTAIKGRRMASLGLFGICMPSYPIRGIRAPT